MTFMVVPGAEPYYVLWGGWYLAKWARFDFLSVTVVDGSLVPGLHVLELLFGENFCGLFRNSPGFGNSSCWQFGWFVAVGLPDAGFAQWWPNHPGD